MRGPATGCDERSTPHLSWAEKRISDGALAAEPTLRGGQTTFELRFGCLGDAIHSRQAVQLGVDLGVWHVGEAHEVGGTGRVQRPEVTPALSGRAGPGRCRAIDALVVPTQHDRERRQLHDELVIRVEIVHQAAGKWRVAPEDDTSPTGTADTAANNDSCSSGATSNAAGSASSARALPAAPEAVAALLGDLLAASCAAGRRRG